jgi:rhodanese-related sulfurtransferase
MNICTYRLLALVLLFLMACQSCKNYEQQDKSQKKSITEEPTTKKQSPNQSTLPLLVVKEGKKQDLGKVREGIKTTVSFTLINKGEADAMSISTHDLSKGGCTAVSRVSRIAAGDSAKLEFIFETLGYGGRKENREIMVRYENPDHSPITLSVTADVLQTEAHQVPIGELYYNFFILVDIRDETSFRKGHIAGAIHVPKEELLSWTSAVPKDFMIYLYSEDGQDSDLMAKKMQSNGYKEALSIIGGIREWKLRYGERVIIGGMY